MGSGVDAVFVHRTRQQRLKGRFIEQIGIQSSEYSKWTSFSSAPNLSGRNNEQRKGIADFKKGAFATKTPVKVWGLKYTSKFHPMNNLITNKDCLIGVCLQLYNTIKVFEIIEPIGPADETITVDEFAKETKLLMCQLFDLEDFEATFEDKKKFEQFI